MYPSTHNKPRTPLRRLAKQLTVAAVTTALMFAGVAPAAAAEVDDLKALIATGEELRTGDYTAHTIAGLDWALMIAKDHIANETESGYWYGIVEMQYAIRLLIDVSQLRSTYAAAVKSGDYTASSWAVHATSLGEAADVLARASDPTFTTSQGYVDTVASALNGSQSLLVDLSGLRLRHDEAMALDGDAYLRHGWLQFVAARDAASAVLADADATNADVATAAQSLSDARNSLLFNMGLHDAIAEATLKDESLYGAATWARFAAAVAVLENLAARDLAGDPVTESEVSAALNVYYPAMYGLLEMAPLRAASEDFASLIPNHFARVAFTELAAITAAIDRVIADSGDPAKIGVPGDQFLLPRYWAKKGELADIRALTAAFQRIDVINHSKHTAYSVDQLRSARQEAKTVVDTYWVTASGVQDLLDQLADLEAALVSITPLEDSLAAAATLDERLYEVDLWSELATDVAAGMLLLANTADPNESITRAKIASAAQAITDAIHRLEITPPSITVGGSPIRDGQSIRVGAELAIAGELLEGGSVLRAELHSTPTLLGSVTAGTDGTAILNVRIPVNTPAGKHTLHVFGTAVDGTPIHHTVAVAIVAGPGSSSNLARTGTELAPLYAGGGLIAIGALLILIRRRYAVR